MALGSPPWRSVAFMRTTLSVGFWGDYVTGGPKAGDQNSDPLDGDSTDHRMVWVDADIKH